MPTPAHSRTQRHRRLEELEGLQVDGALKVLTDAVKELEADVATQLEVNKAQAKVVANQAGLLEVQGKQAADMMAAITALQQANQNRDSRIDSLSTALAEFLAPIVRAPPPAAEACRGAAGGGCAPSVESIPGEVGGGGLKLNAPGGAVVLESKECAATDLCGLARDLQAILARFDDL